jgi:hypothetical protein
MSYIKFLQVIVLCLLLSFSTWIIPPDASAAIQIKLTDISYKSCPPEIASNMVMGGGVMSASCYLVSGKAINPKSQTVFNADVFGRIYDANGNDAMPERTRVGAIAEIPSGTSDFEITISIPADMQEPIALKQFKASGFTGKVRR